MNFGIDAMAYKYFDILFGKVSRPCVYSLPYVYSGVKSIRTTMDNFDGVDLTYI